MRKYLILIFILLSTIIFAEFNPQTIKEIETEAGIKKLIIPLNYDKLKEAYIDMSIAYVNTDYNFQKLLVYSKALLQINNQLIQKINNLNDQIILLKNLKIKRFQHGFILGTGFIHNADKLQDIIYSGYQITLFNKFNINLLATYPIGLSLMIGYQF